MSIRVGGTGRKNDEVFGRYYRDMEFFFIFIEEVRGEDILLVYDCFFGWNFIII